MGAAVPVLRLSRSCVPALPAGADPGTALVSARLTAAARPHAVGTRRVCCSGVGAPRAPTQRCKLSGTGRAAALAEGQPGDAGLGLAGPEGEIIISGFPLDSVLLYSDLPDQANGADCAAPAAEAET